MAEKLHVDQNHQEQINELVVFLKQMISVEDPVALIPTRVAGPTVLDSFRFWNSTLVMVKTHQDLLGSVPSLLRHSDGKLGQE